MTSTAVANENVELSHDAARAIISRHSKSFSLASLLLGPETRHDVEALYAYCRHADDAIDLVPANQQPAALGRLHHELDVVYAGAALTNPVAAAFQRQIFDHDIPREYPDALLNGFELDVRAARFETLTQLLHYCWCVAGSVGAMMCHLLGARRQRAVVHGVHLGMAMQLTNICRDVVEDWQRGRLYLPTELLPDFEPGTLPEPRHLASAVRRLLDEADAFYRSGDAGLRYLPLRARIAVASARRVYSSIGEQLRARGCDVTRGRAVVPTPQKLLCVGRATIEALVTRGVAQRYPTNPLATVHFPDDVLPL